MGKEASTNEASSSRLEPLEEEGDEVLSDLDRTHDIIPDGEELPVMPRPGDRQQRKKSTTSATTTPASTSAAAQAAAASLSDGSLLQVLAARTVDSQSLKKRMEEMMGWKDFKAAERVNWGQWLSSCAGQVAPERWSSFRHDTYELMCKYVPEPPLNPTTTTVVTSTSTPPFSPGLSVCLVRPHTPQCPQFLVQDPCFPQVIIPNSLDINSSRDRDSTWANRQVFIVTIHPVNKHTPNPSIHLHLFLVRVECQVPFQVK